jgi:hypothetical protein
MHKVRIVLRDLVNGARPVQEYFNTQVINSDNNGFLVLETYQLENSQTIVAKHSIKLHEILEIHQEYDNK